MFGEELIEHLFGNFDGVSHAESVAPRPEKLNDASTQEYHTTGASAFGVWAFVTGIGSYFGFLELGVGAAATKYVAEYDAKEEKEGIERTIANAMSVYLIFGVLGAAILVGLAGALVRHFLNVPPELTEVTIACVRIVALGLPISMLLNLLASVLAGLQRFDLYNKTIPGIYVAQSLFMVVVVSLGGSLLAMAVVTVCLASIGLAALMRIVACVVSPSALLPRMDNEYFRRLLSYGAFVTLAGLAAIMQWRLDKLVLAIFLPIRSLAYYSIPFNLAYRLHVIPGIITPVLFPVISGLSGVQKEGELRDLYFKAGRILAGVMFPLGVLLVGLAPDILSLWLGQEFVRESTWILRILTMGMTLNALAFLPAAVSNASGRPHIHASIALFGGGVNLLLAISLVHWLAVLGIAVGMAVSLIVSFALFVWMAERNILGIEIRQAVKKIYLKPLLMSSCLLAAVLFLRKAPWGLMGLVLGVLILVGSYAFAAYFVLLEGEEQVSVQHWLRPLTDWGRTS